MAQVMEQQQQAEFVEEEGGADLVMPRPVETLMVSRWPTGGAPV